MPGVPPVANTVAEPLLAPLQVTFLTFMMIALTGVGCKMVTLVWPAQPSLPVAVTP